MLTTIITAISAVYAAFILLGLVYLTVHAGPIVRTVFWYAIPVWTWVPVIVILVFHGAPTLGMNYLRFLHNEDASAHLHTGLVEGFYQQMVRINPRLESIAYEAAVRCGIEFEDV